MSESDKDELIGGLVRTQKSTLEELNLLLAKADEWGKLLSRLGDGLCGRPQIVAFDGEGLPWGAAPQYRKDFSSAKLSEITPGTVKGLCASIREKEKELKEVSGKLKNLGYA